MVGRLAALCAAGLAAFAIVTGAGAATSPKTEYEIKADFLRTCPRYVDWPPEAFSGADGPFIIGILGKDPFGGLLERAVANKTVNARKIAIRRFPRVEDMSGCHLLFISRSENSRLPAIFGRLGKANVLTVGDTGNFVQQGGAISLLIENERLRWEVNLKAADRAGLSIRSDMVRLAKRVLRGSGG